MSLKVELVQEVMTGLPQDVSESGSIVDPIEPGTLWNTPLELENNGKSGKMPTVCVQETEPQQEVYRDSERVLQRTSSFGKTVKFLLPPITIEDNVPQEDEKQFYKTIEDVLRFKGYNFDELFTSEQWIDITGMVNILLKCAIMSNIVFCLACLKAKFSCGLIKHCHPKIMQLMALIEQF